MSSASSALPLAVGVVMIALALKTELLVPLVKTRCAACRKLVRRGTVCPCARPRD